ncbi:MAG TPA: hypothetical protein VMV49_03890 [Candidatus Deferrimicrobium sp.]|nr:hypothetical protein [Candidatus Deferrimicrobium sp.]
MGTLEILKSKNFFQKYLLITLISLVLALFFNAMGVVRIFLITRIAGILAVIAFALLLGQILLIFAKANRTDILGRKILQLNYITIIIICNCFVYLVIAGLLNSFYLDPASSPIYGQLLAMCMFTISLCFGIGLSLTSYFFLSIESAWDF